MSKSAVGSYQQITPALQTVMKNAQQIIRNKKLTHFRSTYITKDLTQKEKESIEQLRVQIPIHPNQVHEDKKPASIKHESIRPFSARVTTKHTRKSQHRKHLHCGHPTKTSDRKPSSRGIVSVRSLNSFKNHDKIDKAPSSRKCVPLALQDKNSDDHIIHSLRERKLKAQEYEVQKEKFLHAIEHQQDEYSSNQQKFISNMNRKQYTYNYNGGIMETKTNRTLMKRSKYMPPALKTLARYSQVLPEGNTEIRVSFRRKEDKQNMSNREWVMEEKGSMVGLLCPKSAHTKYSLE